MDEEPADIEMSPSFIPHSPGLFTSGDLSLAPASPPPHPSPPFPRGGSVSSESDFDSRGYRASGFHAGEGAYKEVAAFLLDHDRFARVPQTVLAKCNFSSDVPEKNVLEANSFEDPDDHFSSFGDEPSSDTSASDDFANGAQSHHDSLLNEEHLRTKMGAFQVYVANEGDADDFGPGVFDKDQVHRIAILDIRTLNHDRHGGNILVTRSSSQERKYDLVPIDHGYILPEVIQSVPWPVWMDWPMVREPVSDRVRTYIEHLDSDSESHILHEELEGNLRPGSLQALKVATTLLQKGIKAGLSLYDIGLLMYTRREDPYTKSQLEKIIIEAEEAALARDRHLAEEAMKSSPGMPEDHCHRRHQSMSAINTEEMYVDDYIVKYARRSIQDVVSLVAERKENERVKSFSSKKAPPPMLFRARSIPDFGIGIKPLHALLTRPQPSGSVPVNTPCGSPVINGTRNASSSSCLESQLPKMTQVAPPRAAPIKIAINDGRIRRIAIPEPRTSTATETGQFGEVGVAGVIANGISNGTVDGGKVSSVNLPPRCKTTPRKSSPVAPLDMLVWETGSS